VAPLASSQIALAAKVVSPVNVAPPIIRITSAQHGAVLVGMTESTANAKMYYTLDGSAPTAASEPFLAPFLVDSEVVVEAIAVAGQATSAVTSQVLRPEVASGALVWSDEFTSDAGARAAPNPSVWTYDKGASGYGNAELEDYCPWGSNQSPCSAASPNAFVGTDGYLHIVARQPAPGAYTSARMKTQGLFSFRYGRIEFRAKVPEAQGFWPAGWLLGNTVSTLGWPASGEQDVLERVDAAKDPDWNMGSVHGPGFTGTAVGAPYYFPAGVTAATWHTYGMIWKPGSIAYYVDDPSKPYVTFWPSSLNGREGVEWPFDGPANFIILNLAVGGQWPGNPDATTKFPAEMLVNYVRIYKN
jgi:beta-glucanase (GH16 family)